MSDLQDRINKLALQFAEEAKKEEKDEKKEEKDEKEMAEEEKKEFCRKFSESGLEQRLVSLEEGMGRIVDMMEKSKK